MTSQQRDARLRQRLATLPEMTPAQQRLQRISFAYGNVAIEEPGISRTLIESLFTNDR